MFKLQFDFKDRSGNDLDIINAALSGMKLGLVSMEDFKGYNAVSTTLSHVSGTQTQTAWFGFDRLVLSCDPKEDEDGNTFTWQIDTVSTAKGNILNSSIFHDLWCAEHPDRVMRSLTQIDFKDYDAFVVLHHEKRM